MIIESRLISQIFKGTGHSLCGFSSTDNYLVDFLLKRSTAPLYGP